MDKFTQQFKEIWKAVRNFFQSLFARMRAFFTSTSTKQTISEVKTRAQRFESATLEKADHLKESSRRVRSSSGWQKATSKGTFFFNVVYGVFRNAIYTLLILLTLGGFFGAGAGIGFFAALIDDEKPPTKEEMAQAIGNVELISTLHYNNGEIISEVRTDLQRTVIQTDQISPLIFDALVATEDEYFYEHDGIVPKAILRALLTEVTGLGSTTGGSTLTQQLIKQQILTDDVTFSRKANEILLAMRLENYFTKDEIITAYLNVSPFGRNSSGANIAGIEEAARGIFGVGANEVTLNQAAFLVGLPQNPYMYTPYTVYGEKYEDQSEGVARMHTVLTRMFEEGKIDQATYDQAMAYDITQDFIDTKDPNQNRNNFLYQQVEKQAIELLMTKEAEANGLTFEEVDANVDLYNEYYAKAQDELTTSGYKVFSTIDKQIYGAMQEAVNGFAPELGPSYTDLYTDPETGETTEILELAQTGSVLLENGTGRILGFIGGVDFSVDQNDHAFDTPRSVASTIKPLVVYAPAIEMNVISPASMLPDTEMGDETRKYNNGEIWEVSNVGEVISNKLVSAREALYQSMNNPTAKLYIEMLEKGMQPYKYVDMMDFADENFNNAKTVPAFSLGVGDATVQEQTTAFSTFANKGQFIPSYIIERIEDKDGNIVYQHESEKKQVFSPQTAYLTLDILRDVVNEGFSNNIYNYLGFQADLSAKTGTSNNNENYWFIASTPTVTMTTWIGYNNLVQQHNFPDPYFTGAPSLNNMRWWATIANRVTEVKPDLFGTGLTHERPEGIQEAQVLKSTGTLPGKVTLPNSSTTITVDGEKKTDLFKSDALPKELTYNFSPGATNTDIKKLFWDAQEKKIKDAAEKKRKEEEAKKKAEEDKKKAEQQAKAAAESKKAEEEAKKKVEEEKKKQEEKEKETNNN